MFTLSENEAKILDTLIIIYNKGNVSLNNIFGIIGIKNAPNPKVPKNTTIVTHQDNNKLEITDKIAKELKYIIWIGKESIWADKVIETISIALFANKPSTLFILLFLALVSLTLKIFLNKKDIFLPNTIIPRVAAYDIWTDTLNMQYGLIKTIRYSEIKSFIVPFIFLFNIVAITPIHVKIAARITE